MDKHTVPVFDPLGNDQLSSVHPARARTLVDNGRAVIHSTKPYTIKLVKDPREVQMQPRRIITNFTEYFKTERDVFVQNVSSMQISLQFPIGQGEVASQLIPANPDPLNFTQMLHFDVIKRSMDLRKMVNRRPAALLLLTEEEFLQYYKDKALEEGIEVEDAIENAQVYQNDLQAKRVFTTPLAPSMKTIEEEMSERSKQPIDPQEVVTPRLVGICNDDTIAAREMLTAIKSLEKTSGLTSADLDYLLSHGKHASVKNYTQSVMQARDK